MKNSVKLYSLATLIALGTINCQPKENPKSKIVFASLPTESIYQLDNIKDFVFACEEDSIDQIKEEAKKYFLKGIDLRVNQKNTVEGIQYLKKSICIFPEAKSYYELGNALMEIQNYKEAASAFEAAEALRFTPLATLYFRLAVAYALNGDDEYTVTDRLRKAVAQGFSDKDAMTNEKAFAYLQKSEVFQKFYIENFTASQDKASAEFKLFVRGFPEYNLPFELKADEVGKVSEKYISYDFAKYVKEMETGQTFGREVGSEYYYVAKLKETDQYVAVLYAAKDAVAEVMAPVYSYLVTYSPKGEEISKVNFSCQCSPTKIKTGKFDGNNIVVTEFERMWEQEFTDVPFSENKIKSITQISQKNYELAASGKITEGKATASVLTTSNWLATK